MISKLVKSLMALVLFVLLGVACGDDSTVVDQMEEEKVVPQQWLAELDSLVDLFVQEGQSRGVSLDAETLTTKFVDKLSATQATEGTCGYGWWDFNNTGERRVEILDSDHCWHSRSDLEKENFMFHELGHAMLSLNHSNDMFLNSSPRSLMCGNIDGDSYTCNNYQVYYQTKGMRDYYLDQLFNENTLSPAWASNSSFDGSIFLDTILLDDPEWFNFVSKESDAQNKNIFTHSVESTQSSNYQLKINVSAYPEDESIGMFGRIITPSEISDCSTIKLGSDFEVSEEIGGRIYLYIGLFNVDENGELQDLKIHTQEYAIDTLESAGRVEAEIYCVPEATDRIGLYLGVQPSADGTIIFDNVEVSKWE